MTSIKCTECLQSFDSEKLVLSHLLEHPDKKLNFTCPICAQHLKNKETFKAHAQRRHALETDAYPCQVKTCHPW